MTAGISFLVGIASNLAAGLLQRLASTKYNFRFSPSVAAHYRELTPKIREMPFIYKDLESTVISDFVPIELETLNLATLKSRPKGPYKIAIRDQLRNRRNVVVLGQAGTGKTTLLRHAILSLVANPNTPLYWDVGEKLVPVYVPLKAVDNSAPFPILRHVLTGNRIFSGESGIQRLRKLIQRRRFFLLLDGYDEIALRASETAGRNFVQEELSMIFGGKDSGPTRASLIEGALPVDVYANLADCRVWMSARTEFLVQYPIAFREIGPKGVVAVELRGLGEQRHQLVTNIFDKYRRRSSRYICTAPGSLDTHLCYAAWRSSYSSRASIGV